MNGKIYPETESDELPPVDVSDITFHGKQDGTLKWPPYKGAIHRMKYHTHPGDMLLELGTGKKMAVLFTNIGTERIVFQWHPVAGDTL